jgi:hypothetical protein
MDFQTSQNRMDTPKSNTFYGELPAHKKKKKSLAPFILVCFYGIPFKCRMITPFTTSHSYLGRFARGIVNISVLYLIWAFSGLIVDTGDYIEKPGYYFISFVVCFIIARLFTTLMNCLMRKIDFIPLMIVKYAIGLSIIILLHAPILFFTVHMQDEFFHWGMTSIILLFLELVVWETISMMRQHLILVLLKFVFRDAGSLVHQFLKLRVTPPLYSRFIA